MYKIVKTQLLLKVFMEQNFVRIFDIKVGKNADFKVIFSGT